MKIDIERVAVEKIASERVVVDRVLVETVPVERVPVERVASCHPIHEHRKDLACHLGVDPPQPLDECWEIGLIGGPSISGKESRG